MNNPYQAFVRTLCSPRYELNLVTHAEISSALLRFIEAAKTLDAIKRAVFYGKEIEDGIPYESNLPNVNYQRVHQDTFHGIIGICTEAGELAERLLAMATDPDDPTHRKNLIEELGDEGWYRALLMSVLGVSDAHIEIVNRNKLQARYADKIFSAAEALQRSLASESDAMGRAGVL